MPVGSNSASAIESSERVDLAGSLNATFMERASFVRLSVLLAAFNRAATLGTPPSNDAVADIGEDAVVADHDRRRQNVAQMPADAELAVVAIAGKAARLHRAHDGRDGKLGRVDLEQVHAGLKIDGFERGRIGGRFETLQRSGDEAAQSPQRRVGARQMRGARRQRAAGAMRRLAHESAGALDSGGGNAGPGAAPGQMRNRHHGLGVNLVVADGQDLLARAGGDELEALAAGAAHAERVPAASRSSV